MFVTNANLIPVMINFMFDGIYISFWFLLIGREYYGKFISPLINELNELNEMNELKKNKIFYMKQCKNLKSLLILIRTPKKIYQIVLSKRLDKIEEKVYVNDSSNVLDKDESRNTEESNEESTEQSNEEKDILPIQNHITFPHFTIFDDSIWN